MSSKSKHNTNISNLNNMSQPNKIEMERKQNQPLPHSDTSMLWGMIANGDKNKSMEDIQNGGNNFNALIENEDSDVMEIGEDIVNMGQSIQTKPADWTGSIKLNSQILPNLSKPSLERESERSNHSQHSDGENGVIAGLIKNTTIKKDQDVSSSRSKRKHRRSETSESSRTSSSRNSRRERSSSSSENRSRRRHRKHREKEIDISKLSPEELKMRTYALFCALQEFKAYGVELSQEYTLDSPYKLMKDEYDMHRTMRDKCNAVSIYEQSFLTVLNLCEFANESYNPFNFRLKGFSRQVRLDINTYREIFGDMYEEHKGKDGKIAPSWRFAFALLNGAMGYHATKMDEENEEKEEAKIKEMVDKAIETRLQVMFGNQAYVNTIKSNPLQNTVNIPNNPTNTIKVQTGTSTGPPKMPVRGQLNQNPIVQQTSNVQQPVISTQIHPNQYQQIQYNQQMQQIQHAQQIQQNQIQHNQVHPNQQNGRVIGYPYAPQNQQLQQNTQVYIPPTFQYPNPISRNSNDKSKNSNDKSKNSDRKSQSSDNRKKDKLSDSRIKTLNKKYDKMQSSHSNTSSSINAKKFNDSNSDSDDGIIKKKNNKSKSRQSSEARSSLNTTTNKRGKKSYYVQTEEPPKRR
jgi:hypothetical protein